MSDGPLSEFLDASGPLVLGVEEPGTSGVSWRVFDQPFVVVGRDPGSDLFLRHPAVSRRHAYLQVIAGRLFCVDLLSRTGTHWGDERGLWGWACQDPGVRIGPFRIRPRRDGPGDPAEPEAGEPPPPVPVSRSFKQDKLPEATLRILDDPAGAPPWRFSRTMVLVGGAPICKIRLQGGGIAGVHASLLRTPSGIYAIDLMGPGGILVNGKRVRCARIGDGDEIALGTSRLLIRLGATDGPSKATQLAVSTGRPALPSKGAGEIRPYSDDPAKLLRAILEEAGGGLLSSSEDRPRDPLLAVLGAFAEIHGERMDRILEELTRIRELAEERRDLPPRREVWGPVAPNGGGHPALASSGPAATREPSGGAPLPGGSQPSSDRHAEIIQRLEEIQGERQGPWEKVLRSLLG